METSIAIHADNPIALANIEEIEYWLALDFEEQRLDYCLIPIIDELHRLEQTIDDLNAQERLHDTSVRLRQCRARAQHIERKLQDLQAQFPSEDLESRLSQ